MALALVYASENTMCLLWSESEPEVRDPISLRRARVAGRRAGLLGGVGALLGGAPQLILDRERIIPGGLEENHK